MTSLSCFSRRIFSLHVESQMFRSSITDSDDNFEIKGFLVQGIIRALLYDKFCPFIFRTRKMKQSLRRDVVFMM